MADADAACPFIIIFVVSIKPQIFSFLYISLIVLPPNLVWLASS